MKTEELLARATDLAHDAGRRVMDFYRKDASATAKADGSPLTAADRASHETLVRGLAALTPEIPVLSEESDPGAYQARRDWERFWLIDPLDGTREFVAGRGEFTVNVALIEAGRPVLGVVHAPTAGLTYRARAGLGAERLRAGEAAQPVRCRRPPASPLRVVASRSHGGESLRRLLARLPGSELSTIGSALKFCLVAEGSADLYPRTTPTMEWDTAAAQCVLEEAGGAVLAPDRRPLAYNKASLANPCLLSVGDPSRDWSELLGLVQDSTG